MFNFNCLNLLLNYEALFFYRNGRGCGLVGYNPYIIGAVVQIPMKVAYLNPQPEFATHHKYFRNIYVRNQSGCEKAKIVEFLPFIF